MKKLATLLAIALLVTMLLSVVTLSSSADNVTGGYGYYYNQDGKPVMDFVNPADGAQVGTWWWWQNDAFNTTTRDRYLNFLEENSVNEIYYYGFYFLQSKSDRTKLHGFVQEANRRGIAISFIYDDNATVTGSSTALNSICDDYLTYVSEYPGDKLNGIHFDVEHESVTNFANKLVAQFPNARQRGVPISMDVNCAMNTTTQVSAGGVTGNIYEVIAANVDTLTLMSYKDSYNAIWSLGAKAFAAAKAKGCRVVFGVETGDYSTGVAPHYKTFNSTSDEFAQETKEYMYGELAKVYESLQKDHPTGGFGIAIHQHEDWYNLKQSPTPITTAGTGKTEKPTVSHASLPPETTKSTAPVVPTAPSNPSDLKKTTLFDGDVSDTVTIREYVGAYNNDDISTAIRNDINKNGTIQDAEYYEIITTGSVSGSSGYATGGFLTGGVEFWGETKAAGCSTVGTSTGTTTQMCFGTDTDKKGNLLAPLMNDTETQLAYFSDASGYTDTVTLSHITINVYRYENTGTTASQPQPTQSQSQSQPQPTESQQGGALQRAVLYDSDVTESVVISNYIGAVNNDAISTAIRNDIAANGTIEGEEYYEIYTTGSVEGDSGYAVAGFLTGDYEFWGNDKPSGCDTIGTSPSMTCQKLTAVAVDKKGNLLAPLMNDTETQLAYFSDADGYTDTVTISHITIVVYRTSMVQPSTSESTPSGSESTPSASESASTAPATAIASWSDVSGLSGVFYNGTVAYAYLYNGCEGTDGTWGEFISNYQDLTDTQYVEIVLRGSFPGIDDSTASARSRVWKETAEAIESVEKNTGEVKIIFAGPMTSNNTQDPNIDFIFKGGMSGISAQEDTHVTVTVYDYAAPQPTEPSQSETTPSASESTPLASESTPSESTPSASETGAEPTETGAEPTETGVIVIPGDTNGDNEVNMKDVLAIRKYIAGMEAEIDETAADLNGDGAVNMKDVLILRKFLAGMYADVLKSVSERALTQLVRLMPELEPMIAEIQQRFVGAADETEAEAAEIGCTATCTNAGACQKAGACGAECKKAGACGEKFQKAGACKKAGNGCAKMGMQ